DRSFSPISARAQASTSASKASRSSSTATSSWSAAPASGSKSCPPERAHMLRCAAMAGRYGISFAKTLIAKGDYEEAVAQATRAIEGGDPGPEPLFDRATALDLLDRFADAVTDFESAIAKNRAERELDPFALDDAYFSALLSAARAARDAEAGVRLLDRYS